jgi:hypothetical protein
LIFNSRENNKSDLGNKLNKVINILIEDSDTFAADLKQLL